jgi:hypothetical protein
MRGCDVSRVQEMTFHINFAEIAAATVANASFQYWQMSGLAVGSAGIETALSWEVGKELYSRISDNSYRVYVEEHESRICPGFISTRAGKGIKRVDVAVKTAEGHFVALFELKRHYAFGELEEDYHRLRGLHAAIAQEGKTPPDLFLVGVYEMRKRGEKLNRVVGTTTTQVEQALVRDAPHLHVQQVAVRSVGYDPHAVSGLCWHIGPR